MRRRHRNRTPPPTYEVSSIPKFPAEGTRDNVNDARGDLGHNTNDAGGNSGHNVDDAGGNCHNINDTGEDLGQNADDVDGNLDNSTYNFSSDLTNITSAFNIFASQNDSDISMVWPMQVVVRSADKFIHHGC
ncbi:hypothetical protein Glove_856g6 [Diversispora epigaea]|uniref:Uncharacterized protein n=1 Tax=Diversispora epigaea TaxID=1348612 RepID=A0A397G112_9GLOM|nr:hypothetical protein Glove_856g6 [Diversispora epigaea]